jgi:hypothetical protein
MSAAFNADRPKIRLINFKPINGSVLRGFANIELPNGLHIDDCPIFVGKNGPFATPPSKPVLDHEGRHAEVGGKKQYAAFLTWRDRGLSDGFSRAVLDAIEAQHGPLGQAVEATPQPATAQPRRRAAYAHQQRGEAAAPSDLRPLLNDDIPEL